MGSEMGKAFGKTMYLMTTMKAVPRVVGTVAEILASALLAFVGCTIAITDLSGAIICMVAAQVANLCECFIGAALQDQQGSEWTTNDISNIPHILIGATAAILTRLLVG